MILVVGATGQLGGLITRRLLAKGQAVRILAREGSAWQTLEAAGAQVVFGDLKSRASLDAACESVDVVITTANSALRGGDDNTQTVDTEGNRNLIDAAREAHVKQFIFISAFGVTPDSPVPLFQAKARSEAYLRASGLPYTILAPDGFMDVWIPMIVAGPVMSEHPVTIIGEGRRKHSFITAGDVAAFAIASIGHPEAMNRHLPLGGPEAVSWRDVIAAFERALGREIPVVNLAPGEPLPGLPEIIGHLMSGLDMYDSVIEMAETARAFGVKQTSLDDFVRGMLGAASAS
ncbi:MAG: SDR family oxidoreductase [Acidobacteria bacterium]|nr:SDR family oxidoreductase [Acidobacteriota bacterium]